MANNTRFNPSYLVCTAQAGPACANKYDYFTYQPLAEVINDPGYFRSAHNMLRAGTEIRVCRMEVCERVPTEALKALERVDATVIESGPNSVNLFITSHFDFTLPLTVDSTAEEDIATAKRGPGRPRKGAA